MKTATPTQMSNWKKPRHLQWDDAELALGMRYDPNADDRTLEPTEFAKSPIRMKMTVEDVLEQGLVDNPNITIVVPVHIDRFPNSYLTVNALSPDGKRIRAELDWHSNVEFHATPSVRMNPKARLHIIVNC